METPEETDSKLIKGPDNQNDFEDEEEEEKDSYGETLLQGRGEEEYSMINNPRGRAIIFNHYKYDPKLKLGDRKGTQQDEDKIKAALTNLKFQVELHENITFSEIQTVLKKGRPTFLISVRVSLATYELFLQAYFVSTCYTLKRAIEVKPHQISNILV